MREVIGRRPRRTTAVLAVVLIATALLSGCAARRAFRAGEQAARTDQWDAAVEYYRRALDAEPDRPEYRIALERAMRRAALMHAADAATLEADEELSAALAAYRRAYALDPSNEQVAVAIANLQRILRGRLEAARPAAPMETLREQARRDAAPPVLNPASDEPLSLEFSNASLRDILDALGAAAGITVNYDEQFQDGTASVGLTGLTFAQALDQVVTANAAFYKVVSPTTIVIAPDTPQKRAAYEEQVIRTFYVSHANVDDLLDLVSALVQIPQMPVQPQLVASVETNTLIVRGAGPAGARRGADRRGPGQAAGRDRGRRGDSRGQPRPRPSVRPRPVAVFGGGGPLTGRASGDGGRGRRFAGRSDVAALQRQHGHARRQPRGLLRGGAGRGHRLPGAGHADAARRETPVARPGGDPADAQPGAGHPGAVDRVHAAGHRGAAFNPLTSFEYRPIGVVISMTPRVTFEQEIVLDLEVENSTLGPPLLVAGQLLPTFGTRRVTTRLRLRDGESNLLAGLIRQEDRRTLRGLPGLLRLPVLRHLFGATDTAVQETDIVMLLTPRIVRAPQFTQQDVSPLHIGTQRNIGVSGPPPLIAPVPGAGAPPDGDP